LLAQPNLETSDIITFVSYETSAVSARYVKFSFVNSNANFVFCSEALVGVKNSGIGNVTNGKVNVARGKKYTSEGIYAPYGTPYYPDINGTSLTDNKFPTSADFGDPAFVGFNKNDSKVKSKGYATVTVDLGKSYALDVFTVTVGSQKLSGGIAAPKGIEVYVSEDNKNWTLAGAADYKDSSILTCVDAVVALPESVNARYVQYRIIPQSSSSYSWMFLCEVSAYSSDIKESLGDIDASGKVDSLDYLLVKRACFGTYKLSDEEFARANINGDEKINSADYLLVKRIAFGTYKVA
ncbi:MAG: discoidin domain-containing protein, partial [Clostridia bacterium]|nr:discoidin domain-containing protein [Clostridia bacterium]